jgi:hypothetical protein
MRELNSSLSFSKRTNKLKINNQGYHNPKHQSNSNILKQDPSLVGLASDPTKEGLYNELDHLRR